MSIYRKDELWLFFKKIPFLLSKPKFIPAVFGAQAQFYFRWTVWFRLMGAVL